MNKLVVAALLLAPSVAIASRCEPAVETLLANNPRVIEYCVSCGDKTPGAPYVPAQGQRTDVRYTYVQTARDRYDNLALLAGCDADPTAPPYLIGAPQTTTYHSSTTIERPVPWLLVALAAGTGAATGAALIVLLGLRRRRRHRDIP